MVPTRSRRRKTNFYGNVDKIFQPGRSRNRFRSRLSMSTIRINTFESSDLENNWKIKMREAMLIEVRRTDDDRPKIPFLLSYSSMWTHCSSACGGLASSCCKNNSLYFAPTRCVRCSTFPTCIREFVFHFPLYSMTNWTFWKNNRGLFAERFFVSVWFSVKRFDDNISLLRVLSIPSFISVYIYIIGDWLPFVFVMLSVYWRQVIIAERRSHGN